MFTGGTIWLLTSGHVAASRAGHQLVLGLAALFSHAPTKGSDKGCNRLLSTWSNELAG